MVITLYLLLRSNQAISMPTMQFRCQQHNGNKGNHNERASKKMPMMATMQKLLTAF
jgi:hypothetical protein